jgi:hypothetical protein
MKKHFYLFILTTLGIFSCGSNEGKTNGSTNFDSGKIALIDSTKITDSISEIEQQIPNPVALPEHLKKYLTNKQVDSFELAANQYYNIKSSKALAEFYNQTLPKLFDFITQGIQKSNPEVVYAGDDAPAKEWNVFQKYMPCIRVECLCSECSTEPLVNLTPLYEKAKQTPEIDDDTYFKLAVEMYCFENEDDSVIYEGGGNIATWFTMDGGDFSYYNNLGKNIIYKLLKLSEESLASGKMFEKNTQDYRNRFLPSKEMHYGVSKKEVLAEIAKILKDCKLNEEERKQIIEVQTDIKTNNKVQFNCSAGGCTYEY